MFTALWTLWTLNTATQIRNANLNAAKTTKTTGTWNATDLLRETEDETTSETTGTWDCSELLSE